MSNVNTRILNMDDLSSHGNVAGRKAALAILEAGLQAADPYTNARRLLRIENGRLIVGHPDFEPRGGPKTGEEVFDLAKVGRIFVFGAGKGIQRIAKAIEEALGDHITGGHVIGKYGDEIILDKIGVTLGGHPVPDENCASGCRKILDLCQDLRPEDLVFTLAANGVSALLTLPVPGVTIEEVQQVTYRMQIERGAPTQDLNPIRNHIDMMKGGRISRYIQPATAIHIVAVDPNDAPHEAMQGYKQLMQRNRWLHNLPDCTTFAEAHAMLDKWQAWDAMPASVLAHLRRAGPRDETVKADEFRQWNFRIFGIMPRHLGVLPTAAQKAAELGFTPHVMAKFMQAEAREAGLVIADIAKTIAADGVPFEPPCVLLTGGELLVTVGAENGVGGRNQEYALSAATRIAGHPHIVMAGVDTDGTDGPGGCFADDDGDVPCLAGGIVDGDTVAEAHALGVDIVAALRRHDTSPALWKLKNGIVATQNISLTDLGVTVVLQNHEHFL